MTRILRVGIGGPVGSGKSMLIGRLLHHFTNIFKNTEHTDNLDSYNFNLH